jgi:RimJ/RimL family protein N-acetyltransferase
MKKSAKSKKSSKLKKLVKLKKKIIKAIKRPKKSLPEQFYASSKRLAFRLLEAGDEKLYVGLFTDAKTVEHFIKPLSAERAKGSFDKMLAASQQKPWMQRITVIHDRSLKKQLGIASIKIVDADKRIAEVGVLLKPGAQSQQYATEASRALITSAFRRHTIDGIVAETSIGHAIGERLVKTLGYSRGVDLEPCGERGARTSWSMSRETWADSYK